MTTSQDRSVSSKAEPSRLLPPMNLQKLLSLERMEVMVLSPLIMKLKSLEKLITLLLQEKITIVKREPSDLSKVRPKELSKCQSSNMRTQVK